MMNVVPPMPRRPDDITTEWLTTAIRSTVPLTALTLESIGKGRGFVGSVFRCHLQYERPGAGPSSVIAKVPAADRQRRELFTRFGLYEREVGFYRELQVQTPVPTPHCYRADHDEATGDFVLILEDMGDAKTADPLVGASSAECREALNLASRMHVQWWNDSALDGHEWIVGANAPRMKATIAAEYDAAWHAFESQFGQHLPAPLLRLGGRLGALLPQVLDHLSAPPVTLVHGDFQPANIFYAPGGTIAAVGDWQVIVRARGAMDAAYFMVNGVNQQDRRSTERDVLRSYYAALLAGGVRNYPFSQLWDDYRLAVLSQFGLVIVLSHVLGGDTQGTDDPAAAALAGVTGGRLIAAMSDLRPWEILENESLWKRLTVFSRQATGRA